MFKSNFTSRILRLFGRLQFFIVWKFNGLSIPGFGRTKIHRQTFHSYPVWQIIQKFCCLTILLLPLSLMAQTGGSIQVSSGSSYILAGLNQDSLSNPLSYNSSHFQAPTVLPVHSSDTLGSGYTRIIPTAPVPADTSVTNAISLKSYVVSIPITQPDIQKIHLKVLTTDGSTTYLNLTFIFSDTRNVPPGTFYQVSGTNHILKFSFNPVSGSNQVEVTLEQASGILLSPTFQNIN